MQCLCIGVNEFADDVVEQITNELKQLKSKQISFHIDEVNSGNSTSIICCVDPDNACENKSIHPYDALRVHVSNALAECIMKQYEQKLIQRIINSNYCYFNIMEKKEIYKSACQMLKNENKNFVNGLLQIRRKNMIIRKLLEYFESTNNLILDGFVNFRLKEYKKDLEEIVDKAVDEFLMQREYKEFIRLLKYFVDIQEPKYNVVHVLVRYDKKYILLDENKREITNECLEDFVSEVCEGEINYDDLLVSSLITLAPRKVIIHGNGEFDNKELLDTIKNVFFGKVVICDGCNLCLNIMSKK